MRPFPLIKTLALLCFFVVLALILVWTLGPIGLRPRGGPAALGRAAAYALLAGSLTLAFPGRRWRVLALVALLALMLEAGQGLVTGRHGRLRDAAEKIAGAVVGVLATGALTTRVFPSEALKSAEDLKA